MKKLALLFVLLTLLNSCSSDSDGAAVDEPQLTTNGFLIKKIVLTLGTDVITNDYFYNGNKINKIVISDGTRFEYTYTNNLITKNDYYLNNALRVSENFMYDSNQRITEVKAYNYGSPTTTVRRTDFIYNIDGTVLVKEYQGDVTSQTNQIKNKKVFLFPNGDVEKIEEYLVVNSNNETRTNSYTYDIKNAVGNAILGWNKIKNWNAVNSGNFHNALTEYRITTENATTSTDFYSHTYNSYDYPVTTSLPGGLGMYEYFYQQP